MPEDDVFLGLGGNLGDRERALGDALRGLEARLAGRSTLLALSSVYETEPVGYREQPDFLNLVARFGPGPGPGEWLAVVRSVEEELGRERSFRNAPRTLDVDILLLGRHILDIEVPGGHRLEVPHPRMLDRAFVMVPLLELAPDLDDPRDGQPLRAHLDRLETAGVNRLYPGERLREAR